MDSELLIALCVLWLSTTGALCAFLPMWLWNDGESFHPHSVSVDQRHSLFLVVSSETECKWDCCVASISAFVAPRGSSASKNFTVLTIAVAVSGFLGSMRWFAVGDAKQLELRFALFGFGSLIFVSLFELDVLPQRFLEDKLRVTGWLIEKLGYRRRLPFKLHPFSQGLLEFLRESPEIYYLYNEDHQWAAEKDRAERTPRLFTYNRLWRSCHMVGAISYVVCVTTAILLNDMAEEKVAWITGSCFLLFSCLGYLTGSYMPLLRFLKGWILLWNPFLREPHFMLKLKRSCDEYLLRREKVRGGEIEKIGSGGTGRGRSGRGERSNEGSEDIGRTRSRRRMVEGQAVTSSPSVLSIPSNAGLLADLDGKSLSFSCACGQRHDLSSINGHVVHISPHTMPRSFLQSSISSRSRHCNGPDHAPLSDINMAESALADEALDNFALRYARKYPAQYLKVAGHVLVFSELIALLTPAIAMGIQWITALCDGPPVLVIIDLMALSINCALRGECAALVGGNDIMLPHCILQSK